MHIAYGSWLLLPTPETKCLAPPLGCWDLAGFQVLIFRRTLKFFQLSLSAVFHRLLSEVPGLLCSRECIDKLAVTSYGKLCFSTLFWPISAPVVRHKIDSRRQQSLNVLQNCPSNCSCCSLGERMWIDLAGKQQRKRQTFTHSGQSPNADGRASSSCVIWSLSCLREVVSLRNLSDADFQKGPMTVFGTERTFGVGESFFRQFWNTLKVLEYFLGVF